MGSRLQRLSIAGILPLAIACALAFAALAQLQRDAAEVSTLALARALGSAVQLELGRSVGTLQALAASPSIDAGRIDEFGAASSRLIAQRADWMAVFLAEPDGRILSHLGGGKTALVTTTTVERDSFDSVLKTLRPQVGQLTAWPGGERGIPVRVPVVRDGQVRYVLTAVVRPEALRNLLTHQHVADGGVISIFDKAQRRIARSKAHEQYLGTPPAPELKRLLASGDPEGRGDSVSLEGNRTHAAFVRLPDSGWTVAVGMPPSAVHAGAQRALIFYGGGLAASLFVAVVLARLLSRGINRPIAELRNVAHALGRGEPVTPPQARIAELHEVGEAIAEASQQLIHARHERQALLAASDRARRRFERVAAAGETLSHSLESSATLRAVAALVVPAVTDWVRIDLCDADGKLNCVLIEHSDVAQAERLYRLATSVHGAEERVGSPEWVARTGQSSLRRFVRPEELGAISDPVYQRVVREFGLRVQFTLPLVARGRVVGTMAVAQGESGRDLDDDEQALITDLARRFALALDNARLYEEAREARAEAEHANQAKDEFLAMLGHELRNPLAPITTTLALLARRGDSATTRERDVLERQVNHLVRLVDDMLDVSRVNRGKVTIERGRVDLQGVVDRALELMAGQAARVAVTRPSGRLPVDGDAVRLTQVLANLLGNALKFTPADGHVHLVVGRDGDDVLVEVVDDGIGIEPKLLPFVFDPFTQGEQVLGRSAGGLGLGLAIVRTLVELHGGTVSAHSAGIGQGCRFAVRLPLARNDPTDAPPQVPPAALPGAQTKLLVVEDNVDAAESITLLLQEHGFDVRMATSGEAALAQLERFAARGMLIDIGLPSMDGYEVCRRVRRHPGGDRIRLVALTGYGRHEDRAKAIAAGFDAHLAKPVMPHMLLSTLSHLLGSEASDLQRS